MITTLDYATVFTPTEVLERSAVVVSDDGKIAYVGPMENAPRVDGLRLDLRGRIVVPGFINIHVHGGHGITFWQPDTLAEDLEAYSHWVAENGVVGFLCSILAPDAEKLVAIIKNYVGLFKAGVTGAEALGIHLEGPFMSLEKKGAQNPDWLRDPVIEEAQAFLDAGQGWIRQMTLAPELQLADEVASMYRKAGVVISLGHSNTDYETARAALHGNWTNITHTYNAQSGLHHRKPGVVGAILDSDEITAELIADMIHVHPGGMKVLIRCLGTDRVVLITDAVGAAGLPNGVYESVGMKVTVKDGRSTLADGTIAGGCATLNQCVRNVHKEVGVPLVEAVKMASLNPARAMGFADRLGSITEGKDASIAVIDDKVNVYMTMVKGKIVYNNL
jgi:N-acetylglucosamine-6-phosphate deacetylase